MFKNFLVKKMLKGKMKSMGVPADQQDIFIDMVLENPKLFEEIAKKIETKTKAGQNQMMAAQQVMAEYQPQMQEIMAKMQSKKNS